MICQRCLQPFTPSRYGHGETVCPVCAEELAADDRERQSRPTCGLCKKTMTPENSTLMPELFLCDDCARSEQVKAWEQEVKASVESMRVSPKEQQ